MPDLNQLPVPQYQSDQPYHWEYDNLPLKTLEQRDEIINGVVDSHDKILINCAGTQGTLSNRLNQSIDENGNLTKSAIDESMHSIAEHVDDAKTVDTEELDGYVDLGFASIANPVEFVRMLALERIKLASIAENATDITFSVETISNIVMLESGSIDFQPSTTISWEVESPNKVKAILNVSTDFAHRHYYNLIPITLATSDITPIYNKLFKVNSAETVYIEDTLRVYINGVRLNSNTSVYYPSSPVSTWHLNKYTEDYENGQFTLESPITENDVIEIDFDIALT